MYSLEKDIQFPHHWEKLPPVDEKFLRDVFNDAVEMNVYNKDNIEKCWYYFEGAMSGIKYMWPQLNYDQLKIVTIQIQWQYLVDDYLDNGTVEDSIAFQKVLDIEKILISGNIKYSDRKLDQYTLYYRNVIKEYSSKVNKEGHFNFIIHYNIGWLRSVLPFNKLQETRSNPHFDLFTYIRKVNIAFTENHILNFLLLPYKIDTTIMFNLNWTKMQEVSSMMVSLINDFCSYGKEKKNNNLLFNYLDINQKRNNITFEQSYQDLLNKFYQFMDEYCENEKQLIENWPSDSINDLMEHVKGFRYMLMGFKDFSTTSLRYKCELSPFIENNVQSNNNLLINYNSIYTSIFDE